MTIDVTNSTDNRVNRMPELPVIHPPEVLYLPGLPELPDRGMTGSSVARSHFFDSQCSKIVGCTAPGHALSIGITLKRYAVSMVCVVCVVL